MKKILLVTDVYNWIGHTRAKKIKQYLSDEFYFDIMDANEFNIWQMKTDGNHFSKKDLSNFIPYSRDKEFFNFEDFRRFYRKNRIKRNYDLYYFLFHSMLVKKSVKRFLNSDSKIITVATGYPTIKPCFYNRNRRTEEKAIKYFLQLANKCYAVGTNSKKTLEDLEDIYDGKTFYAPRGTDPNVFYPETEEYKEKPNFTVAYVGKPVPEKGLNTYIRQACDLVGADLIINDRNYTNALSPKEMRKFYNKADVYVVASTIDGTPNPALEAAACGRPIISNRIGNMPEFIKDGYNGYLVKLNVNKYAYRLRQLKEDKEMCFEMGMNAREEILKNWTWKKSLENKRKIFREFLK